MNLQDYEIGTEQASEQEQAQYEKAYDLVMRVLHGEGAEALFKAVVNAKNPVDGISQAVFILIRRAENNIKDLEGSVKIQLGEDLTNELLDLMIESDRMKESEVTDQMVEEIVKSIYVKYQEDAESRGVLDTDSVNEDLDAVNMKPDGINAMSTQEVKARGLLDV